MEKNENNRLNDEHRLTDKGCHEETGKKNDFSPVKELVSFLEHYQLPPVDPSSIMEKTFEKIEREKRRRIRRWIVSAVSVAASLALLFTLYHPQFLKRTIKQVTPHASEVQIVATHVDVDKYKDVTLLLAGRPVTLSGKDKVAYDGNGNLRINGKLVDKSVRNEQNQLIVPAGKRSSIVLADGTKIDVNSRSFLVYPRRFEGEKRTVYAEGEAFLDVAHDKQKPFVVKSADFDLQVLGTRFNIRTYRQLKETQVVLVNGSVEIKDHHHKKALMLPNQLVCLNNDGISRQETVDVSEYVSWKAGWLNLDGETLEDIARRLSVYYGQSIVCSPSVADKKLYGKLELKDNLGEVLQCIRQIVPIGLHKDGSIVRISNLKSNQKTS